MKDRRDTIKKDVQEKLAAARKFYGEQTPEWKTERSAKADPATDALIRSSRLARAGTCPACKNKAIVSGESLTRSQARIDEALGTIKREVRVLPNLFRCPFCKLNLSGFQELNEAGLGDIYTIEEHADPIEFFGINPEDYVDIDDMLQRYAEDQLSDYQNE